MPAAFFGIPSQPACCNKKELKVVKRQVLRPGFDEFFSFWLNLAGAFCRSFGGFGCIFAVFLSFGGASATFLLNLFLELFWEAHPCAASACLDTALHILNDLGVSENRVPFFEGSFEKD